MKFLLTTLLITSFIGVAVFGAFDMNSGGKCIASIVQGGDCPREADPISAVSFHLDAFKIFSLTTFGENVMSALLLALSLLFFVSFGIFSPFLYEPPQLAFSKSRFRDYFSSSQERKLNRWLAVHENSPNIF